MVRIKYLGINLSEKLETEEHETSEPVYPIPVNQISNKTAKVTFRIPDEYAGEPDDLSF